MLRVLLLVSLLGLSSSVPVTAGDINPKDRNLEQVPRAGTIRDDNFQKIKFVWCPAGKYTMGFAQLEGQQRWGEFEETVNVELTNGFWIAQTEVTQWQWRQVMGFPLPEDDWEETSYRFKFGRDYPVTYVSLHQALAFCKQLTLQERLAGRLPDTEEYSLPTEAEWEYACRAGTTTKYSFGSDDNELTKYAWYRINASDANEKFAHRVATKKPNPWGLYDMHGNVNEWCLDAYCKRCPGGKDPIVTKQEEGRQRYVYRGGTWNSHFCHSAHRNGNRSETRFNDIGFRPVRTLVRKLPDNFPAQAEAE